MEKRSDPIEEIELDNVANNLQPDNPQPQGDTPAPPGTSSANPGNSQAPTENSQTKKKKMYVLKHGVTMKESILALYLILLIQ